MKKKKFAEEKINSYEGKQGFLKNRIKKWKKYFVVNTDGASINAAIPIANEESAQDF